MKKGNFFTSVMAIVLFAFGSIFILGCGSDQGVLVEEHGKRIDSVEIFAQSNSANQAGLLDSLNVMSVKVDTLERRDITLMDKLRANETLMKKFNKDIDIFKIVSNKNKSAINKLQIIDVITNAKIDGTKKELKNVKEDFAAFKLLVQPVIDDYNKKASYSNGVQIFDTPVASEKRKSKVVLSAPSSQDTKQANKRKKKEKKKKSKK